VLPRPLLLFDGDCSLCSAAVKFVLRWERRPDLAFLPLAEARAQALLASRGLDPATCDSVVLWDEQGLWLRSDAALRVAAGLRWPWSLGRWLRVVPRRARDWLYDALARRRKRWFGRPSECWLPPPAQRARFLDR